MKITCASWPQNKRCTSLLFQDSVSRAAAFNRSQPHRVSSNHVLGASEPGHVALPPGSRLWTVRSFAFLSACNIGAALIWDD